MWLFKLALVIAVAYIAVVAVMYATQTRMLFPTQLATASGPLLPANCQTTIATTIMAAAMIAIFFILRLPLRSDCLRVSLSSTIRLGHRRGVINESLRGLRA